MSTDKAEYSYCVWFTGLPASGKTTIANALELRLKLNGQNAVVLDGDVFRAMISPDLGFSPEDRRTNILRIAHVARSSVHRNVIAICATVSPYREHRREVRTMFPFGSFFEVYVNTPLAVCEYRDPKSLYAKAREGTIAHFTGISAIYEEPESPEIVCDTLSTSPQDNANRIIRHIERARKASS